MPISASMRRTNYSPFRAMYIPTQLILDSISELRYIHSFHGITFVVCKRKELPIGNSVDFPMDQLTREHMEIHHKLVPESEYYFQPFRSTRKWLRHDYPSGGLQSINTRTFKPAFAHESGSRNWAWDAGYLTVLEDKLVGMRRIPLWALAVWLYRSENWKSNDLDAVIDRFIQEYHITSEELDRLFSTERPHLSDAVSWGGTASDWSILRKDIPPPPDSTPERGGTLTFLHIHGAGPTADMSFRPASRMTIITGDNGLGKSFLMECAWWALTGNWAGRPALPTPESDEVYIEFDIQGSPKSHEESSRINYDRRRLKWPPSDDNRHTIPGVIIYARVDGSFAVWDPVRSMSDSITKEGSYTLSNDQVWHGQSGKTEGLIRDWVKWQNSPGKYPFDMLLKVLGRLSPPDLGELKAGNSMRIPHDHREIPTVVHKYGTTSVLYASAGVRRILALSYLMVWTWNEHLIAADLARRPPESRMVVLIDEITAVPTKL